MYTISRESIIEEITRDLLTVKTKALVLLKKELWANPDRFQRHHETRAIY